MGRKGEGNQSVYLAEQGSPFSERVEMRSTYFAVPVAAKVICAQRIYGYQNYRRCFTRCQRKADKGPQDTNEDLSLKPPNRRYQNCKRNAKLITLDVEEPLR